MSRRFAPSRVTPSFSGSVPAMLKESGPTPPKPRPMPCTSNWLCSGATMPGSVRSSSSGLRPMIEMFSMASGVITPSRAPVSVRIISREAVTSTVSAWAPSSRTTSTPTVSFALTRTPRSSWVLKACMLTFSV